MWNVDKEVGSNMFVWFVWGLEILMFWFMCLFFLFVEDWVIIIYLSNGEVKEIRLDWKVFDFLIEFLDGVVDVNVLFDDLFVFLFRY